MPTGDAARALDSLWTATSKPGRWPPLSGSGRYDVVVVGGGITGLTTALLLKRDGARVAVLERGRIGSGVTGATTGKLTSLHRLIYANLAASFDADTARLYATANEAALARIAGFVATYRIDCAFERLPAITYTRELNQVGQVEDEAAAAARAGLAAEAVVETGLPFRVAAAVRLEHQAQFHPLDYLAALADQVTGDGCAVHEHSAVVEIPTRATTVRTRHGEIRADHVVLATQVPIVDRGRFSTRAHPRRSYALALHTEAPAVDAMYISAERPTRSLRSYTRGGRHWLVVSGEDDQPGQGEEHARWQALTGWVGRHFQVGEVEHRWSAHDYESIDRLPFVGPRTPHRGNQWVATGFGKWGLTLGTAAAAVLAERIAGREHEWAHLFDPHRRPRVHALRPLITRNAEAAARFVRDRWSLPGAGVVASLGAGEGIVVRQGRKARAVSRDEDGRLVAVSAVCSHLGCLVRWNGAERSWDCPCHGSRFAPDGGVIQGPALRPLANADPAGDG